MNSFGTLGRWIRDLWLGLPLKHITLKELGEPVKGSLWTFNGNDSVFRLNS